MTQQNPKATACIFRIVDQQNQNQAFNKYVK